MEIVDKKLSNELREKLASKGALGFTENLEFDYVPKMYREKDKDSGEYDIPKELWPVFKLKAKDGIESATLRTSSPRITACSTGTFSKPIRAALGEWVPSEAMYTPNEFTINALLTKNRPAHARPSSP